MLLSGRPACRPSRTMSRFVEGDFFERFRPKFYLKLFSTHKIRMVGEVFESIWEFFEISVPLWDSVTDSVTDTGQVACKLIAWPHQIPRRSIFRSKRTHVLLKTLISVQKMMIAHYFQTSNEVWKFCCDRRESFTITAPRCCPAGRPAIRHAPK